MCIALFAEKFLLSQKCYDMLKDGVIWGASYPRISCFFLFFFFLFWWKLVIKQHMHGNADWFNFIGCSE